MNQHRDKQRGIALAAVAIFLTVIAAFVAVGIDVARLSHTATEVQTVADAAARGGAKALLDAGGTAGVGITRARNIAGRNFMDGVASAPGDVLVDEGFYDTATRQFQCCTSNSACCSGHLNMGDWSCVVATRSCTTRSAVLAMPARTVNNLFAGVFDRMVNGAFANTTVAGSPNARTRVEKVAVAYPGGPAQGCQVPPGCTAGDWGCYCNAGVLPCLPIAAPSCQFPPACSGVGCTLPNLQVSSNGSDTAGWTGFNTGTSANNVRSFLAQGPCDPPPGGPGGNSIPPVTNVGGTIDLNNGINAAGTNNVFDLTKCLYDNNQGCAIDGNGNIIPGQRGRIFAIPIFDSGSPSCTANFNQSFPGVGFATVEITSVSLGNPRTIAITTLANKTTTSAPPGGQCFGTDCRVTMSQ